jgi:6-phosphogluconolactonase
VRAPGIPAFDAIVLGVGDDGHTASLFPGGDAVKETERLVVAVPPKDGREARLTLTPPVLESARALFILAVGPSKFEPLERTWEVSGNASEIPARVIRNGRGSTMWLIDRTAGGA